MISKNIHKFGVELEGAWTGRAVEVKEDSSVSFEDDEQQYDEESYSSAGNWAVGEIACEPCSSMSLLEGVLRYNWPDYYNKTCGMHIHMEMSSLAWFVLATNRGHASFLRSARMFVNKEFKDHGEYSRLCRRLAGRNTYCATELIIEEALTGRTGDRYTAFNALSWQKFRTLELRIWPQLDVITGLKLVKFTVEAIERLIRRVMPEDDLVDDTLADDTMELDPTASIFPKYTSRRHHGQMPDFLQSENDVWGVNAPPRPTVTYGDATTLAVPSTAAERIIRHYNDRRRETPANYMAAEARFSDIDPPGAEPNDDPYNQWNIAS